MPALAIQGGPAAVPADAVRTAWPIITDEDRAAVLRVLDRRVLWAMTRPEGLYAPEQFALEREFADFLGVRHALAVNGGTAGLHMALVAAGVEPGDEVLTPAFSFLATPAAILHAGAVPVFVDIDPRTFNIDPALVERRITPRTRAILAVDIHGLCADWDALATIARRHSLLLVEDACQAPGATYRGRPAGGFGRAAAFSVNGTKNFSVGEGGFMVTDDDEVYYRGNWIKQVGEGLPSTDRTMAQRHLLAWNYRVQELPCALARAQLTRLAAVNAAGRRNAAIVGQYLASTPGLRAPYIPDDAVSVYHKYRIRIVPDELDTPLRGTLLRDAVLQALRAEGVDVDLWQTEPLPAHPMIAARFPYRAEAFPVTVELLDNSFCLTSDEYPIYAQPPELMHRFGEALVKVARHAAELEPLAVATSG